MPDPQPTSPLYADRRGRLSLLCGILLDRKNHPHLLPLGTPPLWGGWVGFPYEGIYPYLEASPPFLSPNGEGREYSHLHVRQYLTDTEVIVF